ncbi:14401_t:CDS:2, partial [Ambispora leptoticha]
MDMKNLHLELYIIYIVTCAMRIWIFNKERLDGVWLYTIFNMMNISEKELVGRSLYVLYNKPFSCLALFLKCQQVALTLGPTDQNLDNLFHEDNLEIAKNVI